LVFHQAEGEEAVLVAGVLVVGAAVAELAGEGELAVDVLCPGIGDEVLVLGGVARVVAEAANQVKSLMAL
jgi:hypothetical protein